MIRVVPTPRSYPGHPTRPGSFTPSEGTPMDVATVLAVAVWVFVVSFVIYLARYGVMPN